MRLAEIVNDLLAGRTYVRTDRNGTQRECYYRRKYDIVIFEYSDPDILYEDDWYARMPCSEDLTADDWEPEVEA